MELKNKKTLVVGLGKTGVATALFLSNQGAMVTVTDMAKREDLGPHVEIMEKMGIRMELGGHTAETFETVDLIVVSPGVSHKMAPIKNAHQKGVRVIGEIELASKYIHEPIVAITGTNGKTTTTELVGKMLENSGFDVFVGGNIGNPLIGYVDGDQKADIVVAEISSFQLDTTETFRPQVGVLLNISEDHLDRYQDFDDYARSKARIFKNQKESDTAVFNASDPLIADLCQNVKSRKHPFRHLSDDQTKPGEGALINNGKIIIHPGTGNEQEIDLSSTKLVGRHNVENITAAGLAALSVGASAEGIVSALKEFRGLAHRLEYVASIDSVSFFDDSKATNVDAVARALECFSRPVILILGGRNKGSDFNLMTDKINRNTKLLVVLGEAKDEIISVFEGQSDIISVETMEDAVFQAHRAAEPGDIVLLSPACASFDMYSSYAQRGDDFCNAVKKLEEGRS